MNLEYAITHEYEVKNKLIKAMSLDKNKYYFINSYHNFDVEISKDTWNQLQMVSIKDDVILGFIGASILRQTENDNKFYVPRIRVDLLKTKNEGL